MSQSLLVSGEQGEGTSYEEGEGAEDSLLSFAPVENSSPLGYNVGLLNATMLNTSAMIGMGIYSTPSFILKSVGSVGMLVTLYIIGPLVTCAGLMVYTELASMCGHKRSGAEVVYLEQAYPRPKYLVSTTFAIVTVLLGYSGVSSTVFAKHVLHALDVEITPLRQRSIAIAMITCAVSACLFSNKWALRMNSVATVFKVGGLVLISLTGLACMLGWTAVPNSGNLKDPFQGSSFEGNALATSFVKVNYSFVGWNTVLSLMAEIKGRDPVRTARNAGFLSVLIASILFLTTTISFVVVLGKEEIVDAGEILGALFIRKVYGDTAANVIFPVLIGISTFGGTVAMTLSYARMLREAGRQGVLPFATFWSRVGRFKTPYGPVLLKWTLSTLLVLATPANDTFAFLVDLASYPSLIFGLLTACGVWILRRRRFELGLPAHSYKAWNFVIFAYVVKSLALLVMPWIPPKSGSHGGDVDFFYATYCIVAIMILLFCGLYYWVWFKALPQWYGYEVVEETVSLPGGAKASVLTRRYKRLTEGEEGPLLQGEPVV